MVKVSIGNDVSSISVERKQIEDERWTPLFLAFIDALKGMGYQPEILEKFAETIITDSDNLYKQEEMIDYLNGFEDYLKQISTDIRDKESYEMFQ